MPDMVREYSCVQCQRLHREGSDPLFKSHLHHQSKHGWCWVPKDHIYFAINETAVADHFRTAIDKEKRP